MAEKVRRPRRLLVAWALWLCCPLYPLYAMYLGRDTHCWLYTVTFGGFGFGWLFDLVLMPLYVADHNETAGYTERAERRHHSWFAWSTPFGVVRWAVLAGVAVYFAIISAFLVPPDSVIAPVLADLFAQITDEKLPRKSVPLYLAGVRLAAGVLGAMVGCLLATPCVLTVRRSCRLRHMLGWAVAVVALLMGTDDTIEKIHTDGYAPLVCIAALATWFGALRGRTFAPNRSPKATTHHAFSLRLARQATCVSIFWLLAGGAYYQNGYFNHTDKETGETYSYTGKEAMHKAYENAFAFYGNASEAVEQLRAQYANTSWWEILAELKEAFTDPAVEAAEVLQLSASATAAEVRKAHRDLARQNHPDKVGDSPEAQAKMQKLNWAKEVLLKSAS